MFEAVFERVTDGSASALALQRETSVAESANLKQRAGEDHVSSSDAGLDSMPRLATLSEQSDSDF